MTKDYPLRNIFGISMDFLTESHGLTPVANAGTTWTRKVLNWGSVETSPGARNWNAGVEAELKAAAKRNMQVILVIEGTPAWALKPGYSCGAVDISQINNLSNFVFDAVQRYSQPPYSIRYWELWNEPDAAGVLGCWGDPSDGQYYGGAYYGQMMASVAPKMKAANPQVQVLVGGLLLNCDPVLKPSGNPCNEANFLKGILAAGAGPHFDGISFHAYDYYQPGGRYSNSNWNTASWSVTPATIIGPSLIAKTAYLRGVLSAYGYPNKYLISTENAIFYGAMQPTPLCDPGAPADVELVKAYYLVQAYTVAQAEHLLANLWFSAIGGRCTSLFDQGTLAPRPAFRAYQFLRPRLQGAVYMRKISEYPGVIGYEFQRGSRKVWVIWSADMQPHTIQLPQIPLEVQVVGNDGSPLPEAAAPSASITFAPRVIEFAP